MSEFIRIVTNEKGTKTCASSLCEFELHRLQVDQVHAQAGVVDEYGDWISHVCLVNLECSPTQTRIEMSVARSCHANGSTLESV